MTVRVTSLINEAQTLDSVVLPAFATQNRAVSTSALVAAVAARKIQMAAIDVEVPVQETDYSYVPLTGASQVIPDDAELVLVNPAGTIAAYTLTMPAAPYDGQTVRVAFDQAITALTMAASGTDTLKGALTAATAKGFATWRYRKADTTWYRIA
jgi:hypothetical protein